MIYVILYLLAILVPAAIAFATLSVMVYLDVADRPMDIGDEIVAVLIATTYAVVAIWAANTLPTPW